MDFEEQLEKAEKLDSPSLVGSSIRSADDSSHNNYIHPEKYASGRSKSKTRTSSKLSQLTASLDDLMSEGALLGSEEDFGRLMDDDGHINRDRVYRRRASSTKRHSPDSVVAGSSSDPNSKETDVLGASGSLNKDSPQESKVTTSESKLRDTEKEEQVEMSHVNEDEEDEEQIDDGAIGVKKETPNKNRSNSGHESNPIADDEEQQQNIDDGPIGVNLSQPSRSLAKQSIPISGEDKKKSLYQQADYSTPNLSEYQLNNEIKDHNSFLSNVKTTDPHYSHEVSESELEVSKKNQSPVRRAPGFQNLESSKVSSLAGFHSPYFYTDPVDAAKSRSRSTSRSRFANSRDRSRSSSSRPHLARGDSYKNTNLEEPSRYELPPDLSASSLGLKKVDEESERLPRHARPKMGDSIAAAEYGEQRASSLNSDTSLVTTGDYTNFDVDNPGSYQQSARFPTRSASSVNYLRSISRSRSRHPDTSRDDEKNDANPQGLAEEGALISDDPYSSISGLDTMVEEVLQADKQNDKNKQSNKPHPKKEKDTSSSEDNKLSEEKDLSQNKIEPNQDSSVVDETNADQVGEKPEKAETEPKSDINEKNVISDEKLQEDKHEAPKSRGLVRSGSSEDKATSTSDATNSLKNEGHERDSKSDHLTSKKDEIKNSQYELEGSKSNLKDNSTPGDLENKSKYFSDKDNSDENQSKAGLESSTSNADGTSLEKLENYDSIQTKETSASGEPNHSRVSSELEGLVRQEESSNSGTRKKKEYTIDPKIDPLVKKQSTEMSETKSNLSEENLEDKREPDLSTSSKDVTVSELTSDDDKHLERAISAEQVSKNTEEKSPIPETSSLDLSGGDDSGALNSTNPGKTDGIKQEQETKNESKTREIQGKNDHQLESMKIGDTGASDDIENLEISTEEIREYLKSQPIYVYTSLAGGMQIIGRTNRLTTILNANGVKFTPRDLGTDEEAKKIWKRQANGRSLPGVVRGDDVVGDWKEIDEANEMYQVNELLYETL